MPLLNYTTTVPVSRTVSKVQSMLVKAGARGIAHSYTDGVLTGLAFTVDAAYGQQAYSLPVDVERVRAVLLRQRVQPRYSTPDHAARVAWRILQDWVAAQLAIIETEMVGLDQVLLPYAHTDSSGATLYERIVAQRSLAIGPGAEGGEPG
jgi:hypothetical protein